MGRHRFFLNKDVLDSSEFSKKRASTEIMKYTQTKNVNKKDNNFQIDYNTLEFIKFKDYEMFMNLVKIFQTYDYKYNNCDCGLRSTSCNDFNNFCLEHASEIPEHIMDGLKSYIYNDELIMYAKNCKNSRFGYFERITDTEKYDNQNLYDYGYTYKSKNGQNFEFPSKIYLDRCSVINDPPTAKQVNESQFGNYSTFYPSQYEFLRYSTNKSCIDASKKQMDAFSIFPRHSSKLDFNNSDTTCNSKCGISSKMQYLLKRKKDEMALKNECEEKHFNYFCGKKYNL